MLILEGQSELLNKVRRGMSYAAMGDDARVSWQGYRMDATAWENHTSASFLYLFIKKSTFVSVVFLLLKEFLS